MALQFDPGAYFQANQQGQQNQQSDRDQLLRSIAMLSQGIGSYRQSQRQAAMDLAANQFRQQQQARQGFESQYKYGTPISQDQMIGSPSPTMGRSVYMPGGQGAVGTGSSLIESFNKWRAGGMNPQQSQPEYMPALGQVERKAYQDTFKPQPQYVIPGADGNPVLLPQGQRPSGFSMPKDEPNYAIPNLDANGNVVGFTPVPKGTKPTPFAKPPGAKNNPMASPVEVQSIIGEINRVQELNKNSYGGFLGNLEMKSKSALNMGEGDDKFKNTADVINTMQQQVARVLKSTFGGQLSDAEREYLNNVYGALSKISQTERDIAMTNVKRMLSSKIVGNSNNSNGGNTDLSIMSNEELLKIANGGQ